MSQNVRKMSGSEVILVVGGAGYIGSHVCKALKQKGFRPVTFDSLVFGHQEDVKWGPFFQGDILQAGSIDRALEKFNPDVVMHFAGFALVGESVSDPGKYYQNNVVGSLNLLESMKNHGVKNLIFSSSCAVYGISKKIPIPENHSLAPVNPYGWTKFIMERMMEDFSHSHGLNFVALRYFNAAGADPEGEIGERHDPETHLIPLILDTALKRRKEITIFGTDYDTPDGTCVRDYIHVSDLADAHIKAWEYLRKGGKERYFNLGTGTGHSVREIIAMAEKVTGKKVPVAEGNRRAGDPPRLVCGGSHAEKILGWKPKLSDIETIMTHAWEHRSKCFPIDEE